MIITLMSLIVVLFSVMMYLIFDFYKQKKIFRERIMILEDIMVQVSRQQLLQSNQVKLIDDFQEHLKIMRTILSEDIFRLNYEMLDLLSLKEGVKKRSDYS